MTGSPDLVLLPGLLCDEELWREVVDGLSGVASCRVADLTSGNTLEELAEAVLSASPPRFALAGFSFGGYVAQEILRRAPGRVERLALLDTSIRPDTAERQAVRLSMAAAAEMPGRFAGITGKLLPTFIRPERLDDTALATRIRAMTQRVGRDVFVRQSRMSRPDGEGVLRSLRCPTLILCGRQDALTPLHDHEEMATLVPHGTLAVIEDCGHMAPMEQPAAVSQALRRWLQ